MFNNPDDAWTFLTVSNTYKSITLQFPDVIDHPNIKFIDCISRYAGLSYKEPSKCTFIESPTMLEKTMLRLMGSFENVSKELLYIYADIDGDGVLDRVPLFDESLLGYFWDYDNNGLKVLQLRFYEEATTVPLPEELP